MKKIAFWGTRTYNVNIIHAGRKLTGARFGSTIVNIGDINKDGFADVAIGAPGASTVRGKYFMRKWL